MTSDSVDDIVKLKKALWIPVISPLAEYMQSVIVAPNTKRRNRQLAVWEILVYLVVPTLMDGFARVNWLPAKVYVMGYHSMPGMEDTRDRYNPFRGKRNKKHQIQAIGIAVFAWILAKSVSKKAVMKIPAMAVSRSMEWFKFVIV